MAKQLTDDELNLRRKARRRLIGAAALSLAVVVILPMVLESEPRPAVQDIELRIPAPGKVGEFTPGVAVSEVAEAAPAAVSAVEAAHVAAPASAAVAVAAQAPASAPAAVPVVAPAAPAVAASAVVQAKPVAASGAGMETPAKTQAAKQPEPKVADQPAESFVAQVGAYASAATAKQELDKLKKLGFRKAYTEKVDGKTRVRVGPYAEREKAEQVRQMLEKHGLKPVVMGAR